MKVLVIADHNNDELNKSTLSTVTAGKKIGKVDLLIIGNKCENVVKAASNISDVEKIFLNEHECFTNFLSENCSEYIKQFSSDYSHILFTNNSSGKNIAPRTAALLDSMIIPDIIEVLDNETFKRPIYAGNAIATCKSKDKIKVFRHELCHQYYGLYSQQQQKKDPLILPPDFENLPLPSDQIESLEENSIFENVLENSNEEDSSGSSSVENSILRKIQSR